MGEEDKGDKEEEDKKDVDKEDKGDNEDVDKKDVDKEDKGDKAGVAGPQQQLPLHPRPRPTSPCESIPGVPASSCIQGHITKVLQSTNSP